MIRAEIRGKSRNVRIRIRGRSLYKQAFTPLVRAQIDGLCRIKDKGVS